MNSQKETRFGESIFFVTEIQNGDKNEQRTCNGKSLFMTGTFK